jgi:hypothetical protein
LIASKAPFVSAFKTIFNCFKLPALILDIRRSKPEALFNLFLAIISLN